MTHVERRSAALAMRVAADELSRPRMIRWGVAFETRGGRWQVVFSAGSAARETWRALPLNDIVDALDPIHVVVHECRALVDGLRA